VVGVDIKPQPNYPFTFIQDDALEAGTWLNIEATGRWIDEFDAIHASPPCQAHVQWNNLNEVKYGERVEHPDLIEPTRALLRATGLPYVIENVVGAPLETSVMLCGSHFGLNVRRHRLFESNMLLLREPGCMHTGSELAVYGKLDGRRIWTRADQSEVRAARTLEEAQAAMGIDWMTWDELREAIPPDYTTYIGSQLYAQLEGRYGEAIAEYSQ
jgi:DNA (cytosine-5)-methyltransferase 1